ncbi:NUDIX domain-containing protein [Streptomyces sp. NPDC056132]|uniref:NUDIX domain-containing protein n=1 Tax=Streptomyces sp. NPDC056132 TaxID=3345722 RepID=UPI0035D62C32
MSEEKRYTEAVDLHLVLRDREGRVALGLRQGTGWMDGHYHLPSGHKEMGESAAAGAVREAAEETGVDIKREELRLVHVMSHYTTAGRTALFFEATRPEWDLVNTEPDKCGGWAFFAPDALPEKIVPYAAAALGHIRKSINYSERGWENS